MGDANGRLQTTILEFERRGLVTRTFRRLDLERQQAVIGAILDDAAARGPTALNVKAIARRAGVAVGSLYAYFPDRRALLRFAAELTVRQFAELLEVCRPQFERLPLGEAIRAYVAGGIEWNRAQGAIAAFLARAAYQGDPALVERIVRPIATTMREFVHAMLVAAARRGEIRGDVDLEATARVIHGLSIAVADPHLLPYLNAYFQVFDDGCPSERTIRALVTLVLEGLAPPKVSRPGGGKTPVRRTGRKR